MKNRLKSMRLVKRREDCCFRQEEQNLREHRVMTEHRKFEELGMEIA